MSAGVVTNLEVDITIISEWSIFECFFFNLGVHMSIISVYECHPVDK